MGMERYIRLMAGTMTLVSLGLGYWLSPWFLLLTVFVGVNLLQSSLTQWCFMEDILSKSGVEPCRKRQG